MQFSFDQYMDDLKELVSIDCGTRTPKGVHQVADIVERHFNEQDGWHIKRTILSDEVGPILEISNKKDADHYDVTLLSHMDTVYAEGTVAANPPRIEGDKYFAPGASDMKSGVLTTIYALKALSDETKDQLSICFALTPDEEIGAMYSYSYLEQLAKKSSYVLVTEAARASGNLIHGRKGNGKIQIDFHGKAAHAGSNLQDGVSAITEFAHWVHLINDLVDLDKGTSLSVGIVKGGAGINVVPDYCQALVDQRFLVNEEGVRTLDTLQKQAETPFLDGASVKVTRLAGRPAFEQQPGVEALISLVETCAEKHNISFGWEVGGGASDGNITASMGIPTLDGFGPCGAGFHNVDTEYVLISSIEPRTKLLHAVLEKMPSIVKKEGH